MTKAKNTTIQIPIDDWVTEWEASPVQPQTQDDIMAAMQETAMKPSQMGRLALVGRELGHAEQDILRPNKVTLQLGLAYQITRMIQARRVDVEVGDKTYSAREFVASVEDGDGSEEAQEPETAVLVDIHDELAVERASKYLFTTVCGFIFQRLLILAANKQDVRSVAEKLKTEIDLMTERLT